MSVTSFTNEMGFFTKEVSGGDWLGQTLHSSSWRYGQGTARYPLADSTTMWRSPTPYERIIKIIEETEIGVNHIGQSEHVGGNTAGCDFISNFGGHWPGGDPEYSFDCYNEAHVKARSKVLGSKAKLGTALAEGKQVLNLLSKTSISLLRGYKAIKNGSIRGALSAFGLKNDRIFNGKEAASRWLELQYGWRPLVRDLHDIYGLLGAHFDTHAMLVHSRGTAHREYEGDIGGDFTGHYFCSEKCLLRFDLRVDSSSIRNASQLGLLNPSEVAWELVPFSFLIDWFTPIGNTIAAAQAFAGLELISGSRSLTMQGVCYFNHAYQSPTGSPWVIPGRCVVRKFATNRAPWGDELVLPYRKESPFSSTHVANAAALFRSLLR